MTVQEMVVKSQGFELFRIPGTEQTLFPVYREDGTPTGTLFCSVVDPGTRERINFETEPFDVGDLPNRPWTPGGGLPK